MARYTHGLVPISGDPITFGHIDLIERAARECTTLTVLIANSDAKRGRYTFDLPTRVELANHCLKHLDNVCVIGSDGLLVDVFLERGCDVVFRGIRNMADQEYELSLMGAHNLILPGFTDKVEFLLARQDKRHISSSAVRELVRHGVDVSGLVPIEIKAELEEKLLGVQLIGVTGEIATGKSHVASRLAARMGAIHINMDDLIRQIYTERCEGTAKLLRELSDAVTGMGILNPDGSLNKDAMRHAIFTHPMAQANRKAVEEISTPYVLRLLRKKLVGHTGKRLIIIEWAQLVEMNMCGLVNNRVIVVSAQDRDQMLRMRGISSADVEAIARTQLSAEDKVAGTRAQIEATGSGEVFLFENTLDADTFNARLDSLVFSIE